MGSSNKRNQEGEITPKSGVVALFLVLASRDRPPLDPPLDIKRKNRIEGHQFE